MVYYMRSSLRAGFGSFEAPTPKVRRRGDGESRPFLGPSLRCATLRPCIRVSGFRV